MLCKTYSELAKFLDITYSELTQLRNSRSDAPKTKDTQEWQAYLDSRKASKSNDDDDIDNPNIKSDNLERIRYYKAERERIAYLKEKGELVPLADIQSDEAKRYAVARKRLLRLPSIAGRLAGMTINEIQNELQATVDDTLRAIVEDIKEEADVPNEIQ